MKTIYIFLLFVCCVSLVNAQIINIPGDQASIQAGIEAAAEGDTVLVTEGTYFENINFRGKPITVASQFILDGDTSHISKTIIDGSQSSNQDTASVVTMWSGEDTTSVLAGFTLTGGKGTYVNNIHKEWPEFTYIGGGGVLIFNSGGKIVNNIIEDLSLTDPQDIARGILGLGILAAVNNHHTAIIRHNIIRNNTATDVGCWGGGIGLHGGRMVVENNAITNNRLYGQGITAGPGILFENESQVGTIEKAVIRNNIIAYNAAYSNDKYGFGGGIALNWTYLQGMVQLYNNVIVENFVEGYGGGLYGWSNSFTAFNNTILNNEASEDGNSVFVDEDSHMLLYNNIIWSDVDNDVTEIGFWNTSKGFLKAFYNIHKEPFDPADPVTEKFNMIIEPRLSTNLDGSMNPSSPAIGRAVDSLFVDDVWYYAPGFDIMGSKRPDPVDSKMDLGAVESTFQLLILAQADLLHIVYGHRDLQPSFHPDTLQYTMGIPDTTIVMPLLDVIQIDWLAELDINPATSLESSDPADRTTTITVTADDGSTRKIYTVLFNLLSTDGSLRELSIDRRSLEPEFEPDELRYKVWLPYGSAEAPELNYSTTHRNALAWISPALDITSTRKDLRTTNLKVTPEAGVAFQWNYWIEFNVDNNPPTITLASETLEKNDPIKAICSKSGQLYLVPMNTPRNLDSIVAYMIDSTEVMINDTVYFPTSGLDLTEYWLYAVNKYESVSEVAVVSIIVGINEFKNALVRLYPSPVEDVLYIESKQPISSIELYNIIGVRIMDRGNNVGRISLGHLKQGTYFIRIKNIKGEVYTGKVMKF